MRDDTVSQMRRFIVICAALGTLAVPSAALAMQTAPGDGSLVVKNASALSGTAVVALTVTGTVWGHVGAGRIVIDDSTPTDESSPIVTGAGQSHAWQNSDTALSWSGVDFKFRAVGGKYTILIYGSGVDVVAFGSGYVTLTGVPATATGDGFYSRNGESFRSLPGAPGKRLSIGTALPIG
jgi:hypothetical protein